MRTEPHDAELKKHIMVLQASLSSLCLMLAATADTEQHDALVRMSRMLTERGQDIAQEFKDGDAS